MIHINDLIGQARTAHSRSANYSTNCLYRVKVALCDYSWQCYAGVKEVSKIRAEPVPDCSRKPSQDFSVDKYSTVDSLDSDVAIIDVGSPSSEQYKASDKTPSTETKKRGLDTPVVQSEFKVSRYKIHTIIWLRTCTLYHPSLLLRGECTQHCS